jgi:hypothetical protein
MTMKDIPVGQDLILDNGVRLRRMDEDVFDDSNLRAMQAISDGGIPFRNVFNLRILFLHGDRPAMQLPQEASVPQAFNDAFEEGA